MVTTLIDLIVALPPIEQAKFYLLLIPTLCYLAEGLICVYTLDFAGAVTWGCYGLANTGLVYKFIFEV
jgi:hypothetical protein